jgi:hypothetical protein
MPEQIAIRAGRVSFGDGRPVLGNKDVYATAIMPGGGTTSLRVAAGGWCYAVSLPNRLDRIHAWAWDYHPVTAVVPGEDADVLTFEIELKRLTDAEFGRLQIEVVQDGMPVPDAKVYFGAQVGGSYLGERVEQSDAAGRCTLRVPPGLRLGCRAIDLKTSGSGSVLIGPLAAGQTERVVIELKGSGSQKKATAPTPAQDKRLAEGSKPGARDQPAAARVPDWKWNLPPDAPSPAIVPFDAKQAQEHQAAWAKYLGVPVEMANSIGTRFVLIPPGEFDMGATEAEVAKVLEQATATNQPKWRRLLVPLRQVRAQFLPQDLPSRRRRRCDHGLHQRLRLPTGHQPG